MNIIIILCITLANSKFLIPFTDKIDVDLKYVRSCLNNNLNTYDLQIFMKKYNRTHVAFDLSINLTEIWDHTFELDIEIQLWGDGGWKKNFFRDRHRSPCQRGHLLLGSIFYYVLEVSKAKRKCPIDPGYYGFEEKSFDLSYIPILVQEGKFYAVVQIIKNDNVHSCMESEVVVAIHF